MILEHDLILDHDPTWQGMARILDPESGSDEVPQSPGSPPSIFLPILCIVLHKHESVMIQYETNKKVALTHSLQKLSTIWWMGWVGTGRS